VKQLQQFLGMVNFYRRFLPGIARTLQPLTDALNGAHKALEWPPAAAAAFGAARVAHPAPNAVLSLATDASDTHVGGVLQQLTGGRWQPLAFYSKKLSGAGTRYSTFDRELLAAFSAVRHFRFLLKGRQFRLSLTTSHWSHPCSAPSHRGRPANSDIRASFREDSEFSPAEAVFGSQLILPGRFVNTAKSPSPSFLSDLQTTMTSRPPPPTRHNSAPAPSTLPEELLLACFILVRRDGAQLPLSPIYDGPYRVLERSTHFFLLEMGERTDKVCTLRLKAARTPADTEPAKPPRRGRPIAQAPPVRALPPKQWGRPRQVTFNLPPTTPPTTTSSSSSASGRPLHNAWPPNRLNL
jgi:hypothetical protein